MRRKLLALAAAVPAAAALCLTALPAHAGSPAAGPLVQIAQVNGEVVPGQYIVTTRGQTARTLTQKLGIQPRHTYDSALSGFSAKLTDAQLRSLQRDRDVVAIEPDQVARIQTTQINPPSWGLDRIDQNFLPLNSAFTYNATGAGVRAYVIDTGVLPTHPAFGGNARVGYDALGGNGIDCHGHGTHVAGTVGAPLYGVAKAVRIIGVRVLDCGGSGTYADVIEGIDWVNLASTGPSVANMSLGGGYSAAVNTATTNLANSGVFVAVASANDSADACGYSPASTPEAVTVNASSNTDAHAWFSNYGPCTDIYAPGVGITSLWLANGFNTISGTSMASPHVAGVAALYKHAFGEAPSATIHAWIVANSTPGVITGIPPFPPGTPNRLLFTNGL